MEALAGTEGVARGGYVLSDSASPDCVLVATGSEVPLALDAQRELAERGVAVRVVSMPCVERFLAQDAGYQDEVLSPGLPVCTIEAGATLGWQRISGRRGLNLGIDRFGASAPAGVLAEKFGFTAGQVSSRVASWLEQSRA